jgi:hypothetical protein
VWKRTARGITLTFHLAGINNQNFLMRDDQTGTYWQQISGRAVAGPLAGSQLELVPSDELSFALWHSGAAKGTVLKPVSSFAGEYAPKDWDIRMKRAKTVLDFPNSGLKARDLVLGVEAFGVSRAYPVERLLRDQLTQDRLNGQRILIVVGPDRKSLRVFQAQVHSERTPSDYYRYMADTGKAPSMTAPLFVDSATGSNWSFEGCAVSGPARGQCLPPVSSIKDYWFDWRNYHPQTTIFKR